MLPLAQGGLTQQAYVKAGSPEFRSQLGTSVAISGDTMVVGGPGVAPFVLIFPPGALPGANILGSAIVYVRTGGVWTQQAILHASNGQPNDLFGCSVAISGDTIVVGAKGERSNATGVNGNEADTSLPDAGAAYVFVRSGSTWTQQAYLKASNTGTDDRFGESVAISGDSIVVGATGERSTATGVNGDESNNSYFGAGAAYVFNRTGTVWSQQAYLKASNTYAVNSFGISVAIEGNSIAVGAEREFSNATGINGNQADRSAETAGAVYVFARDGTAWAQEAYLKGHNTDEGDYFGHSLSMSGNTLVVGANGQGDSEGAAYVFIRGGTTWSQQAYLQASNVDSGDTFGSSVSISGDTIIVGAPFEASNPIGLESNQTDNTVIKAGAAYLFTRHASAWAQQAYLKPSHFTGLTGLVGGPDTGDTFGTCVAVSGNSLGVGAPYEDSGSTGINSVPNQAQPNSGAAFLFQFSVAAPSGVTLAATSLAPHSAVLNSRVNPGLSPTTVLFDYADSVAGPFTTVAVPSQVNGNVNTFPGIMVTGLQQGTTYYFRALASNAQGSALGDILSFTTPLTMPVLTVDRPTVITDIHTSGSSFPRSFTSVGGELYFVANDAAQGWTLRRVTAGGSEVVADVNGANTDNAGYANLTDVNGILYFTADDGTHGNELWKLGPTGPTLVADLNVGSAGSFPNELTVINGVLFYAAETVTYGREIYLLSPTGLPVLTDDLGHNEEGSSPEHLTRVGNWLFFTATTTGDDRELFYLKPMGGGMYNAVMVDDDPLVGAGLHAGSFLSFGQMVAVGDTLYFDTTAGFFSNERILWRVHTNLTHVFDADRIYTTTALPGPFGSPGFPYPANYTQSGSTLYFTGSTPASGNAIWKVDSPLSSPVLVANLLQPGVLTDVNGTLYFSADDGTHGQELWRTTTTGVERLGASYPSTLTVVDGQLFFNASDATHGQELWHILPDGSPAMMADASPGTDSSTMFEMVSLNGRNYCTISTSAEGLELWTFDTLGNPRLVKGSHVVSTTGSNPDSLTVFQGVLYFQADDGVHGSELWRTTDTIPTVNVLAGHTAVSNGLVDNALDVPGLVLSASIGTVTLNAAAGTWSWSKPNAALADAGDITITASNSSSVLATTLFHLTVESTAQTYAAWAASYGLTGLAANPTSSLPNDGTPNLLRYAFNISPSINSPAAIQPGVGTSGLPYISRIMTPTGPVLHYEYVRRSGASLTYTPKKSINLTSWSPLTSAPTTTTINAEWERVTHDEPIPPSEADRMFGIFEITDP